MGWRAPSVREPVGAALRERPLATAAGLLAVLAGVRAVDVLVLHLHEHPGTLLPSAVAMLVVGAGLAGTVPGPGRLALDRRRLRRVLAVGVLGVAAVQLSARLLELAAVAATGGDPVLVVRAENPATASADPVQVGAYLLGGVLLTAVGEELFFRRAVLGSLAGRHGFWRANALQAALFGLWHFAWPLAYAVSPAEPYPPLAVYGASLVVVTGTAGLLYGWLVRATGSLWTAVAAHVLHNLAAVVLHVRTTGGDLRGSVVAASVLVGYLALALAAHRRWA